MKNLQNEEVKTIIRETISSITGISSFRDTDNLLDKGIGIMPVDFLYVFDRLEKQFNLQLSDIFTYNNYTIMTVENLANAIKNQLPV